MFVRTKVVVLNLNFSCQFLHVQFMSACHTSDVGLGQLSIVSHNLCIQNNEVPFWCHFVFGWSIKIKFYNSWTTCKFCYGMVSFLAHWKRLKQQITCWSLYEALVMQNYLLLLICFATLTPVLFWSLYRCDNNICVSRILRQVKVAWFEMIWSY